MIRSMGSLQAGHALPISYPSIKKVMEAVDQDENYDVVYLDFRKAFDKVPHQRLLKKVEGHGIDSKVLKWIGEWLN